MYRYFSLFIYTSVSLFAFDIVPQPRPDPTEDKVQKYDDIQHTFRLDVWFSDFDGKSGIDGFEIDSDYSYSDNDGLGTVVEYKFWQQDIGYRFSILLGYWDEQEDWDEPDLTVSIASFDGAIMTNLIHQQISDDVKVNFNLLGGGRLFAIEQEIYAYYPYWGYIDDTHTWIEPFIGADFEFWLNNKFYLFSYIDYGTLGFGDAATHTCNFKAGFGIELGQGLAFEGGYRILDINIDTDNGDDSFILDAKMTGYFIGMAYRF
ncbi:MAG: hypothetical protein MK193_04595 [Lentisphaeria bacterium]|nr:hypothetical protein [Lentisphaeria bacterium]